MTSIIHTSQKKLAYFLDMLRPKSINRPIPLTLDLVQSRAPMPPC
jgi:hypothetical protein